MLQIPSGDWWGREQQKDQSLRNCWAKVRLVDGKIRQPTPHPPSYTVIKHGLLYCVAQWRGKERIRLVLPNSRTREVIEEIHSATKKHADWGSAHRLGPAETC